eukprot:CAMPEP_0169177330 /NCGR_PEP_ID=MMETSP1015-20121227/66449_1 /TAXON_ID=342587 /ORGANISM="Karlodinium micrum, Strain CCMP2283" /LENGTH=44 /DNA_ID= /DNA_START= /DNA_END= /DNA_ORIENTATION=
MDLRHDHIVCVQMVIPELISKHCTVKKLIDFEDEDQGQRIKDEG